MESNWIQIFIAGSPEWADTLGYWNYYYPISQTIWDRYPTSVISYPCQCDKRCEKCGGIKE